MTLAELERLCAASRPQSDGKNLVVDQMAVIAYQSAIHGAAPALIAVAKAAKDLCQTWDRVANPAHDYGPLSPEYRPAGKLSLKEALAALDAAK